MPKHENSDRLKRLMIVTVVGAGTYGRQHHHTYIVAAPNIATATSIVRQHFSEYAPKDFQDTVHVFDPLELDGDSTVLTPYGDFTLDDVTVFYIK